MCRRFELETYENNVYTMQQSKDMECLLFCTMTVPWGFLIIMLILI